MRRRTSLALAAIAVVALGAAAYRSLHPVPGGGSGASSIAFDTPPGIMLQPLGGAQGYGDGRPGTIRKGLAQVAYADAAGKTLYTYDKDTEPGKPSCSGDCAKSWPAAIAPPYAKPVSDWSIVPGDDGNRRWTYRGKPLYTFSGDANVGDSKGNGAAEGAWRVVLAAPALHAPLGIAVEEVPDARGYALVDERGMTLYTFDGTAGGEPVCSGDPCIRRWLPVRAGAAANAIGDFAPVLRADGITQWVYKGKPLYVCACDIEPLDANGQDVNGQDAKGRWHVALVSRHFMPPDLEIRNSRANGKILTDGAGMTVYRRDAFRQEVGIHGLAHGALGLPAFGRMIGTRGCDTECLRNWRPLKAPPDAWPSGYWDIAIRDDSTRQWVYKGYALYTYSGDKKPGDFNGNDIYDYLIFDTINKLPDVPPNLRQVGAGALYWAFTAP